MKDIIIKNCSIYLNENTISNNKDIIINDGYIVEVLESDINNVGKEVIEGKDKLVLPGLVDGHTHVSQQFLRGKLSDEYPMIWTRFLVPFESTITPELTRISTKLAMLEMIKFGTTGFADSGGLNMDVVAEEVINSGMRASLARSVMDMGNDIPDSMKEGTDESIRNSINLYKSFNDEGSGRIKIWFGLRQLMTCSKELIEKTVDKAIEYNTGIHAHLCEHKDEVKFCLENYRKRPVEFLNSLGALNKNLLTAHNVTLSAHDIDLLTENKVKLIHCPRANLNSHGFPKTPEILNRNGIVGIGSDGASSSSLNLFDELKALKYSITSYYGLPIFDPHIITVGDLLGILFEGSSIALQHKDVRGKVEVGNKADIILLDINKPHLTPTNNIISELIESADGRDVVDSIIDGKIIMKNREVLTLDEEKILFESKKIFEKLN